MSDARRYMPIESAGTLRAEARALEREVLTVRNQVASLPSCSPHRPRLEARLERSEARLEEVRSRLADPPQDEPACSCRGTPLSRNALVLAGVGLARIKAEAASNRRELDALKGRMREAGFQTERPERQYMPTRPY